MKWFHCAFFHHYLELNERASRREFWWYNFVVMVILIGSGLLSFILSDTPQDVMPVIYATITLVLLCPSYSVLVRRLHDTGRSGWWGILILLPVIGWLVLFVFMVRKSQECENRFGPPPVYFFE
ncbi:uncharacterized membrane protein YhaH (DUF805 family) [Klebsiella oxytoca]|uniref:Uncharacterized membrane protein YhaH (DUF805 family) n=1 Tax=Klebsiella oxytoca TaxID=571 RepID=A0A318FDL3_KLEOX|nr:DUF805 domain-containing protein [Klebsiella oxytoca]PXW39092.1 uncharacterized membrane protein YhaH (DUF805 family) [Klebsiella oxytoca]